MLAARGVLPAAVAALALTACGTITKPVAGRGRADDPRTQSGRLACLLAHRLPVTEFGTTGMRVGGPSGTVTITFAPTRQTAVGEQIVGRAQAAEVVGSALLYPNQAPDSELQVIEDCLAQGVPG